MKSRLLISAAERAGLWDVVARHRQAAGDKQGAAFARWQAKSMRSNYPVERPRGITTRND